MDLIEKNEILLIDHLSNPGFISSYRYDYYLEKFYEFLSSLDIHVVIISFPHKSTEQRFIVHKELARNLAADLKIAFIDFKESYLNDKLFDDPQHINLLASYIFGEWLGVALNNLINIPKPKGAYFSGFNFIQPDKFTGVFENSLLKRSYYEISDCELRFRFTGALLSLEYVSNEFNRFEINECNYHIIDNKGVFHDSFRLKMYSKEFVSIKISNEKESTPITPSKQTTKGLVNKPLRLVGILTATEFHYEPSKERYVLHFDSEELQLKLDNYTNLIAKYMN
ncbi:hypothetical protein [Pseudoalteromonas sp. BSi20652]|uniref:hypothetical protein n=1 Tax=Pseudoalteromonas sp. BSi20652 TaxID=388384 RepID=UPI00111270AD|nr:hypothetical protein [Pseudoalteromonas sp. BSi20652]